MLKNNTLFTVHQNPSFKKLVNILSKEDILSVRECANGQGLCIEVKDNHVFLELVYFSLLLHDYSGHRKVSEGFLVSNDKNIGICMSPAFSKTGDILQNLIAPGEEIKASDNLFNSLIALYIANGICYKFLYPNTYIIELGEGTHEIDIIGCIVKQECFRQSYKYIMVENTLGFLKKRKDGNIQDTHREHFKKAVFKKWLIEKVFNTNIFLIYISVIDTLNIYDDGMIKVLLDKDKHIKIFSFLSKEKAFLNVSLFSHNYMDNYRNLLDFLERIRKSIYDFYVS